MSDFFKSRKFKILLLVVALLLGMMLYTASSSGLSSIPQALMEMIVTPVQKLGASISSGIGGFFDEFLNSKRNADENVVLKEQNAELINSLVELERLRQENQQLREIAGIKERYTDFETMPATVISRDPDDRYDSFVVDRGMLDGVAVNDPVITQNGLVGTVSAVGPTSARVKTIISPEISVGAIEIVSKELGIVSGSVKLSTKSQTKLEILSAVTGIKEGDLIVTAGSSGNYPKDIPIGRVKEILTEDHGVTKYAVIEPLVAVESVESVVIVTNFFGQGDDVLAYD